MNATATPAIDVRDVTKKFGSVTALDRVSFAVRQGELFFLLGPSGCGKTTMLRILAGIETPDSGTVLFGGTDMATVPPHRRGAPMVFQNYALWPHLSVAENVAFGLVERRVPRTEIAVKVAAALRNVGLEGLGERTPGQLSGGQQQRVALARALALDPAVILLDEPLSNLDAKLRLEMRAEIRRLHAASPITFVYVTHDQAEALSMADTVAVMRNGRVSASGTPHDLYHRPPNVFCAEFLGDSNLVGGTVAGADAGRVRVITPLGTWQGTAGGGAPPAPGAAVTCMVRPENIRNVPARIDGTNTFEATVKSVQVCGATVMLDLDAAGHALKAAVLNEYATTLKPGLRALWAVTPGNTVVLQS